MIIHLNISSRVFNPVYLPIVYDRTNIHLIQGGTASGKSKFGAQKDVLLLCQQPGHIMLHMRKVQRTLRRSMFKETIDVINEWGLNEVFDITVSPMEIKRKDGKGIIYYEGIDNPTKLRSITGITRVSIEEATELTKEDWLEIDRRIRGPLPAGIEYRQMTLRYNPDDYYSYINTMFFEDRVYDGRFKSIITTHKDNLFLLPEDRAKIEALKDIDETHYQIFGLGQWGKPQHTIFRFTIGRPTGTIIAHCFAIDFGINNPTCITEILFNDRGQVFWNELLYESHVTNEQLIERLPSFGIAKTDYIYGDPEDKNRIEEIYNAGYNIHPARKNVIDGIDYCNRFHIVLTPESINGIREMQLYKWMIDRNGHILDKPVKFKDHFCDAGRYGTYTHGIEFVTPNKDVDEKTIITPVTHLFAPKESATILKGF